MAAAEKEVKPEPTVKARPYADDDGHVVLSSAQVELCAAKNDVRYYLNEPYLDMSDLEHPMLVATNGHVLVAAPVEVVGKVSAGPVPGEAIKRARKHKTRKPGQPTLTFARDMVGTGDVMFRRHEPVHFPDWRKVIDEEAKKREPDLAVNGDYMTLVQKAITPPGRMRGVRLHFCRDEEGAIDNTKGFLVTAISPNHDNGVIGVVMPMRD